ncbi:MAG: cache domain-containing protein [Hyphomicrobiales bacterium]
MAKRVLGVVLLLAAGLAAGFAIAALVERHEQAQALSQAFNRLRLFHNLRQAALEDYLASMASDVRAASENPHVVEAMEKLNFAWTTYGPDARKVLPQLYIDQNPAPPGEKDKLDDAGDNSYYSLYHKDFHVWAKRFREHFGYHDAFLINPRGDIIYSIAKEIDFATSLKTGPYRTSPLAEVFRRAIINPSAVVDFSDFARYAPSNGEPAAFAGHAIIKDGNVIGVFAVQIPAEPLNELMHFTAGMGATGETYVVGPDGLMRSQSRFITTPTLLETKVDSLSVRDGIEGKSGAHLVSDYRGVPVLSVYAPINFGGQPWVLIAEIDRAEALEERKPWMPILAGGIAGLLAIGIAVLLWRLLRRSSVGNA